MTSKEALEILLAGYYNNANYQDVIEAREKLEQDLDRLEIFEDIIRKYCYIKKYNDHKEITEITMSLSGYDEEEKCYLNFLEKILKTYEDNKYHDK